MHFIKGNPLINGKQNKRSTQARLKKWKYSMQPKNGWDESMLLDLLLIVHVYVVCKCLSSFKMCFLALCSQRNCTLFCILSLINKLLVYKSFRVHIQFHLLFELHPLVFVRKNAQQSKDSQCECKANVNENYTSIHITHIATLCIMSKAYISNNPNATLIKFSCEMKRLSQPRNSTIQTVMTRVM